VERKIQSGELPATKIGRAVRISAAAILAYVTANSSL
jgi:excisionase family DNA binding protein